MTVEELLDKLKQIPQGDGNEEELHIEADKALLEYINDERVTAAFRAIPKWYS